MVFAKLFSKLASYSQNNDKLIDLNPRVITHYGIPSSASRLAYDPIQQLLAIGTLDGKIKIIGSYNIEGLLSSPKGIPFKNLEFLHNKGLLISISNENDVQVWDLEQRCIASSLQWPSNITAFAVIQETNYMYLGDECGLISVLKYDNEERELSKQQFSISAHSVSEAAGTSLLDHQSVVGVLSQPCSCEKRVLFAYGNGVVVLWNIFKDQLVLVRGLNDQHRKDLPNLRSNETKDQTTIDDAEDKEIVSLCWASLDGSILAVGYVDGDIMLWNMSDVDRKAGKPTNNMVKLQLSSANRRFPVIVLQWAASAVHNDHGGQLFVYGGDEMGSPEVIAILSLEWSPDRSALKNVVRTNISLEGSFADMMLLQSFSAVKNTGSTSLFLLCSPGQLQFYDSPCLLKLTSHQNKSGTLPVHYRNPVPTTEPYLTIGRLILVRGTSPCSVALSEMASAAELERSYQTSDKTSKWPLNGGVPCHLPLPGEGAIERLYIAGYRDGSVRVWNATYPMLSPLCILYVKLTGITISGTTASISALDFSSETQSIAVGNESGMVCLYHLSRNQNEAKLHVVTANKSEVCKLDQGNGPQVSAVFTLDTSPVRTLMYKDLGARLAIGYESGKVAMLYINSPSVLFFIDVFPSPVSPVVSLASAIFLDVYGLTKSSDETELHEQSEPGKELIFALRSDMQVAILDSSNGNVISSISNPKHHNKDSTAISMYILEGTKCISAVSGGTFPQIISQEDKRGTEPAETSGCSDGGSDGVDKSANVLQSSGDLQILLCCTNVLLLYSLKSLIQGDAGSIHEVNLLKSVCWTTTFMIDEQEYGLLVFYQNGYLEIRSLPKLEVLGELSLMSVLRWNFKTTMDRTMSSTENGQIALVNGCEFVIVSLLARENDFRIPHSLPCLHDHTLAAALSMDFSPNQTKNQKETSSGILGGIMKGLKSSKEAQSKDRVKDQESLRSSLDRIFSRCLVDPSTAANDARKVVDLNIDDIDIDGPVRVSPIAQKSANENKDKSTERKKLFEGATSETKPKQRSIEEIKAQYRKTGNTSSDVASAASAAAEARNKLLERQEKLERIDQNSEELRNNAEDFASMAKELAKRMERRKWWQF